jgi:cobalt-zinc-cadmium efflux system protein
MSVEAALIIFTGFDRADAIASLAVAALMFRSGFDLQRKAARVLLEGAPEGMSPTEIGMAMAHGEHVKEVHDLHVWELAPGQPLLTAHVLVTPDADCHAVRRTLEQMLKGQFKIEHTTLQVDHAPEPLLSIRRRRGSPPSGLTT